MLASVSPSVRGSCGMYRFQLTGPGCRVLCWEGFWGWRECQELLVMSVMGEEGEGGKLAHICQLWTPSPSAPYSGWTSASEPSCPQGSGDATATPTLSLKGEEREGQVLTSSDPALPPWPRPLQSLRSFCRSFRTGSSEHPLTHRCCGTAPQGHSWPCPRSPRVPWTSPSITYSRVGPGGGTT